MLYENRELEPQNYFKKKRLSFVLIKVLRFIQNRLIAMHECYFLMLELGALLQYEAVNFQNIFTFISSLLSILLFPYIALFLYSILRYTNSSVNSLNYILFRYSFVTSDLKFVQRNDFDRVRLVTENFSDIKQLLINNYHALTFTKKLLTPLLLFLLCSQPFVQIICLIVLNVFYTALLFWLKPYNMCIANFIRLLQELCFLGTLTLIAICDRVYNDLSQQAVLN